MHSLILHFTNFINAFPFNEFYLENHSSDFWFIYTTKLQTFFSIFISHSTVFSKPSFDFMFCQFLLEFLPLWILFWELSIQFDFYSINCNFFSIFIILSNFLKPTLSWELSIRFLIYLRHKIAKFCLYFDVSFQIFKPMFKLVGCCVMTY